jgi:hypothetical protein
VALARARDRVRSRVLRRRPEAPLDLAAILV